MRTRGTVRKVIRSTLFGGAALLLVGADGCDLIYRYVQCILNGECTYLAADFFGFSSEEEPPPLPQRNAGVPAAAASGAEFGASLAAPTTGTLTSESVRLVVGAPGDQTDAGATGAVYVYSGPYDSAAEPIQLVPSDGESGARFGAAVDIQRFESFDIILVGAPGSYPSGAVYVFESNGSAWVQTARFVPDGDDYYSEFGASVAIVRSVTVGDTLAVVGTPSGGDGGHVNVIRRSSSGVWAVDADGGHEPSFQPADVSQGDRFGACLATVGRFVAVGAPGRGGYMGAGAAFLFSYDAASGAWTESPTRMEPEGTPSQAAFGTSVAITSVTGGNTPTVIVGAPGGGYDDERGTVWTFLRGEDGTLARRRFMSTLAGYGGAVAVDPSGRLVAVGSPNGYGDPTFAANSYSNVDFGSDTHTGRALRGEEPWSHSFRFGSTLVARRQGFEDDDVVYVGAPGEGRAGRVYRFTRYGGATSAKKAAPAPEGNRYLSFRADDAHPGADTVQVLVNQPLRPPFRTEVTLGSFDAARRAGLAGGSIAFRLDAQGSDPQSFVLLRARFGEAGLEVSAEDEYGGGWQQLSMPSEWIADFAIECNGSLMQLWARPRGVGEFQFVYSRPQGDAVWNASTVIEGIAAGSEVGMDDPRLVANAAPADGAPPVETAIDKIYAAIDREMALSTALDDRDLAGALLLAGEAKTRFTEAKTAVAQVPAKRATTGPKVARRHLNAATRELAKARTLIQRRKRTKQVLVKLTRSLAFAGRALAALQT